MPNVFLNETNLFYFEQGSGAPLIFIHGLGGDHHLFDPQIEVFSQNHRVIVPHNRGNGLSGPLDAPAERVIDEQCEDLAELLHYLKIEQAVVCGTSYGGVLGFHFALQHPELLAGLVITDSFSDTRIMGLAEALTVFIHYISIWTSFLPGEWMIPMLSWRYRRWPKAKRFALYVARTIRKRDLALQRLAIHKIDYTDQLHQIHCPVLGIVGDSLKLSIQAMKRAIESIPGGILEIVQHSFDPTNLCQSEVYNDLLFAFLKKIKWD